MPAVRPVVFVWNVECSSCRCSRRTGGTERRGIVPLVLAIAREQVLQPKLEPWKMRKEELRNGVYLLHSTNRKIAQIRVCHNRRMGRASFYKKGPTQRAQ
jgi:hypothetical protein